MNTIPSLLTLLTNETDHFFYFHFADGDLGYYGNAMTAYMKQKHRMIWERRHGKIGSGKKQIAA